MPDDTRTTMPTVYRQSLFQDMERFEFGQRVAKVFAESQLVPQHLRGKLADCLIALDMAERMGEDPIMVMQNIFFVHGRAGWAAQYMISRANRSGIFNGPLRWRTEGSGPDLSVTCFADLAHADDDDRRVEITVSLAMAEADGWTRNEKYQSIPEQMLRWRSASWLIRLYCPEVMMGLPSLDELEDTSNMKDVTPPRPELAEYGASGQKNPRPRQAQAEPTDPAATETKPADAGSPAKFFFSDADGIVHEYDNPASAVVDYSEMLAAAAKDGEKPLAAAWENSGRLLHDLRAAGHETSAEALHQEYNRLMTEVEARATRETAKPPEQTPAPEATSTEPPYDVLVPLGTLTARGWCPLAQARIKAMVDEKRPADDFKRFRIENSVAMRLLLDELPNWHKVVAQTLTANGG